MSIGPQDMFDGPDDPYGRQPVEGIVAATVASIDDLMHVYIPSFADDQTFELRWMPRGDVLPQGGNRCLVVFTRDGSAWVPAWWPS